MPRSGMRMRAARTALRRPTGAGLAELQWSLVSSTRTTLIRKARLASIDKQTGTVKIH